MSRLRSSASDPLRRASRACWLGLPLALACAAGADGGPLFPPRPAGSATEPPDDGSGDGSGAPQLAPSLSGARPPAPGGERGSAFGDDDPEADDDARECSSGRAEAEVISEPVDIIVVLDNSGSMANEARAVETNLNANLASILQQSGIDYRVILLSEHREQDRLLSTEACIAAPLSGLAACPAPAPVFGSRFFHYSVHVGSRDSLRLLLETYDGSRPDQYGLAPLGWSAFLRPGAKKVFLELSDDDASMSAAEFLTELTALAPEHFGTDPTRPSLVWHSIVGLSEKPQPTDAYTATEALQDEECRGNGNNVFNAGETYQELSQQTGGLRFPICQFDAYDTVFQRIAADVVTTKRIACGFAIPAPPADQRLELDEIAVSYTAGDGAAPVVLGQVTAESSCAADAFLVEPSGIRLCPQACDVIRATPGAALDVLFTCESTVILR